MIYHFLRILFRAFFFCFARWQIRGQENVPPNGPVLLVANHSSNWDPLLVGCALDRQVSFMAKAELFQIPLIGKLLPYMAAFPIKRGETDIAALRTAIELLKEERILGIFPEGTRSKTKEMLKFKTGVAMLAYKGKCPVLPLALIDSKNVFTGWLQPVKIVIGKAFIPEMPVGKPTPQDLENIAAVIQGRVEELRGIKKLTN